jgi:hypothetical protein
MSFFWSKKEIRMYVYTHENLFIQSLNHSIIQSFINSNFFDREHIMHSVSSKESGEAVEAGGASIGPINKNIK